MSMRRIHTVKRAAKAHTCSRCGATIAKGEGYLYWEMGFRPSYKRIRCLRTACYPKPSERETSNVAEAYASQEDAVEALDALEQAGPDWGEWQQAVDAVTEVVTTAGEAIDEVATTYREADEAFGGLGATEHAERADTLEQAASDLADFSPGEDEPQDCGEHAEEDGPVQGCSDCEDAVLAWYQGLVQEARDMIDGVELP